MKKKLVLLLLSFLVVSMAVACGKSEKQKAAENLQEELGLSKDEANELAELFYGDESYEETEKNVASISLVSPRSEIVNSKITDPFVQVENSIIYTNETMTIGEAVALLEKESGHPIVVGEDEQSLDSLIDSISIFDSNGIQICKLYGKNYSGNPTKVSELPIQDFGCNSVYQLNCFYSGNICMATYSSSKDVTENAAYQERIANYPALKYEEVPAFFEKNGLVCTDKNFQDDPLLGTGYIVRYINPTPVHTTEEGENEYVETTYGIGVDLDTATCASYNVKNSNRYKGNDSAGELTNLDFLDKDTKDALLEDAINSYLTDFWNVAAGGAHSTKAEIKGYFCEGSNYNGTKFALVFETDGLDKGCVVEVVVKSTLDGEVEINNIAFCYSYMNIYVESYDEWFEKKGLSEQNILTW